MPAALRKDIEMKYGFPAFTNANKNLKLCDREKLIISDIWSFWYYAIKKKHILHSEINFLTSLLDQAKFFFTAAESSPVKSQPLLYYYCFLNFAKLLINMNNYVGPSKKYMHGVEEIYGSTSFEASEIKIHELKRDVINVSAELYHTLDDHTIVPSLKIKVIDLLRNCVGIHRTYCEIYDQKEDLFRISSHKLFKNGLNLEFEATVECASQNVPILQASGYSVNKVDDAYVWSEQFALTSHSISRKIYLDFSNALRAKGIWYFIGNSGYTYYLSTNPTHRFPQEFAIYNAMFYLGSITRYTPYRFDELFSAKEQWLMSEFLKTQPKQFLYLSSAKLLSQSVLKAHSVF